MAPDFISSGLSRAPTLSRPRRKDSVVAMTRFAGCMAVPLFLAQVAAVLQMAVLGRSGWLGDVLCLVLTVLALLLIGPTSAFSMAEFDETRYGWSSRCEKCGWASNLASGSHFSLPIVQAACTLLGLGFMSLWYWRNYVRSIKWIQELTPKHSKGIHTHFLSINLRNGMFLGLGLWLAAAGLGIATFILVKDSRLPLATSLSSLSPAFKYLLYADLVISCFNPLVLLIIAMPMLKMQEIFWAIGSCICCKGTNGALRARQEEERRHWRENQQSNIALQRLPPRQQTGSPRAASRMSEEDVDVDVDYTPPHPQTEWQTV